MDKIISEMYVVDKDFHIIHADNFMATNLRVDSEKPCYTMTNGGTKPCVDCPLVKLQKRGTSNIVDIKYNEFGKYWLKYNAFKVNWHGQADCTMVYAEKLDLESKNIVDYIRDYGGFEEILEIDVTGKYCTVMLSYNSENINSIHEFSGEDKEFFAGEQDNEYVVRVDLKAMQASIAEKGAFISREYTRVDEQGTSNQYYSVIVPKDDESDDLFLCFNYNIYSDSTCDKPKNKLGERNAITGVFNKASFIARAGDIISNNPQQDYHLLYLDIEKFKLFNDWHGQQEGDVLLSKVGKILMNYAKSNRGVAGYINSDDFVLLMESEINDIAQLQNEINEMLDCYMGGFRVSIGVYKIENDDETMEAMIDMAAIAMSEVKKRAVASKVVYYDAAMKTQLKREQKILFETRRALINKEFKVYYQPKCNIKTGKIIGLEALVRWQSPKDGLISPGEFIPVLESHGYITNLDLYVWEQVCKDLRQWIDKGNRAVPVSVNVSRADFTIKNLPEIFCKMLERYNIEKSLFEIEITESTYVENEEIVSQKVAEFRRLGFKVLMDDFGSGYSSLNMLKDVEVDVLKVDMRFLSMTENSAPKGLGILETVVRLAKWMRLSIIAEGVETKEQAEFLLSSGCFFAQGYLYYKALPREELEFYLNNPENVDYTNIYAPRVQNADIAKMINNNLADGALLDNIIGGFCIVERDEERFILKKVNDKFAFEMNVDPALVAQYSENAISVVYQGDREKFARAFDEAENNFGEGARCLFRIWTHELKNEYIDARIFYLTKTEGKRVYYCVIKNVSEKIEVQRDLDGVLDTLPADVYRFTIQNSKVDLKVFATNLYKLRGYDSKEEYSKVMLSLFKTGKEDINMEYFDREFKRLSAKSDIFEIRYKGYCKDGSEVPMRCVVSKKQDGVFYAYVALDTTFYAEAEKKDRFLKIL